MIVDAHFHQWCLARDDYGWITPALTPIYRDFNLQDWRNTRGDVAAGILVQCAASVAETEYLLGIAHSNDDVLGVVGWVDLESSDAVAELQRFAATPKLVGIRPMIQDIADPQWMLRPNVVENLAVCAALGLCFDALVLPQHLPVLQKLRDALPDLAMIIDHAAKPRIAVGEIDSWREDMRSLAASGVYCKLSGLLTEAATGADVTVLKPYVDVLLETFTAQGLVWGSDWPVVNLAADYGHWLRMTRSLLADLSETDRSAILANNALDFYRLLPRGEQ